MSDFPGYAAAQRAYENMTPPEDGPSECRECGGSGTNKLWIGDRDDKCQCCGGTGMLDENGEPFDPHAAEYAADQAADRDRDERATRGTA